MRKNHTAVNHSIVNTNSYSWIPNTPNSSINPRLTYHPSPSSFSSFARLFSSRGALRPLFEFICPSALHLFNLHTSPAAAAAAAALLSILVTSSFSLLTLLSRRRWRVGVFFNFLTSLGFYALFSNLLSIDFQFDRF